MENEKSHINVVTRGSNLALEQTRQVVALLKEKNPSITFIIKTLTTQGDREQNVPLNTFAGQGVFVKELERSLLDNTADIAIHSLKDVPSIINDELTLCSFPPREEVEDVIISTSKLTVEELNPQAIIGTGSPRRIAQLKQYNPLFQFKDIRGNIDTRIQKLKNGDYDAIILAKAGLKRIHSPYASYPIISLDIMTPAIGQASIVLQCRKNDTFSIDLTKRINDKDTEIAVRAERIFMETMEGGCRYPMAAYAHVKNDNIIMQCCAFTEDYKLKHSNNLQIPIQHYHPAIVSWSEDFKNTCKQKGIL